MSPKLSLQEIIERIATGFDGARLAYDADADELEIVLPGTRGRAGRAILVNESLYLRLDVDTNEPLSIIIPTVSDWLSRELVASVDPPRPSDPLQAWQSGSHEALFRTVGRTMRASGALAAAVA